MVVEGGKIMLRGFFLHVLPLQRAMLESLPFSMLSISTCYTLERLSSCAVGLFPHRPSVGNNYIFLTPQKIS